MSLARDLDIAVRTSSVRYSSVITTEELCGVLLSGEVPSAIAVNVRSLLDDAPAPLIARLVEGLRCEAGIPSERTWDNLRRMARDMQVKRDIFERIAESGGRRNNSFAVRKSGVTLYA
jgi:hypothetical protein